jgi:hypothetical protein
MTKFIAFAVDAFGAPLVRYHLAANEGEGAEREARQYLECHRVIEVFDPMTIGGSSGSLTSRTIATHAKGYWACWPTSLALL